VLEIPMDKCINNFIFSPKIEQLGSWIQWNYLKIHASCNDKIFFISRLICRNCGHVKAVLKFTCDHSDPEA